MKKREVLSCVAAFLFLLVVAVGLAVLTALTFGAFLSLGLPGWVEDVFSQK